jgi:hypothetical protein
MKLEILTKIKEAVLEWYSENFYQTQWFIIGFMVCDGFNQISKGETQWAILAFALAGINYMFVRQSND